MAKTKKKDLDSEFIEAKKRYALCAEAWDRVRAEAEDDLRMKVGDQWPTDIRELREKERRPVLTFNRLHQFIGQVLGDIRKEPPSIKVRPVEDTDIQGAEVINALLQHIQDSSNASVAFETAYEHALSQSFGYFRILVDYADPETFDQDIIIERIDNPFTVYIDPYTKKQDRSDMRFAFVSEMISEDEFERRYPDSEPLDVEVHSLFDDREAWVQEKSVRIAEYWSREPIKTSLVLMSNGSVYTVDELKKDEELRNALDIVGATPVAEREVEHYKVTQRIMNGVEFLEEKEWPGQYIPIVGVFGREDYVDGELMLFSLIRHAKDAQRMYNFWRTSEAEIISLQPKAPYIATPGQIEGFEDMWEEANHQQFPYLLYNPDPKAPGVPQRQPTPQVPAGVFAAAQSCIEEMKAATGVHDASLGMQSIQESGRAILARQHEGDIAVYDFTDNLMRSLRYAGKIILDLIPKVYTTARIIRITGEDGTEQMVPINQPQVDPMTGMTLKLNDVSVGKYDVTVDTAPSFATQRIEASNSMVELLQALAPAYPQAAVAMADLIAGNMDFPGADDIAERLRAILPPQMNGQNPEVEQAMQAMQAEIGQRDQMIQALSQQLNQMMADRNIDQQKADISAYDAETKRIKTMAEVHKENVQNPVQVYPQLATWGDING